MICGLKFSLNLSCVLDHVTRRMSWWLTICRVLTFRLVIDSIVVLFCVVLSISLFKSYKVKLKVSFALRESRKKLLNAETEKFKYRRIGLRKVYKY